MSSTRQSINAEDAEVAPGAVRGPNPFLLGLLAPTDRDLIAPQEARVEPELRGLLDAVGVAFYATDAAGRITFFNDAAASLWGRRPKLGEKWCGSLRLFWPDGRDMPHDQCPMARTIREGRPVRGLIAQAERPDGSRVAFEAYPSPLRDRNGVLVGAINVLVDITERLAAEEALRANAEEMRRSSEVKDEFLGLVSHELRTPVTTIYGNAQVLLQRSEGLSEELRLSLQDVADNSERLLGVIENLLLLTRVEAGSVPELEPQLLEHALRRSCEAFAKRRNRKIVFSNKVRGHLIVEADRVYLDLLVGNLLSNADKYSPPGAGIDMVLDADDREARVAVMDRGIGLGGAEPDKIFTPFYRSPKAKRYAGGMGIGLAVCKRIAEAQRGRMWATARDGGGAEVGFSLPLLRDPDD